MKRIDDISLVSKVVMFHDKRAFDALVVKYQEPVRRFFMSQTLGDKQLSDDLAQNTFIKAYTNIARFRGLSGFSTWLYRIAFNVYYDYRRAHKDTSDAEEIAPNNQHTSITDGLKIDIYDALTILKADERTCVTLGLIEGLPMDKIAEITGMKDGTVRSHISRGKQKLAKYLKDNGYDR